MSQRLSLPFSGPNVFSAGYKNAAMAVFVALTQGIICAGLSVYANQLFKQAGKEE